MNIVISFDDNYVIPARIMLDSLSRYNNHVELWLIHSGIQQKKITEIEKDVRHYGWNFNEIQIDEAIKKVVETLPCGRHFTKEMYYRLFLPWILTTCDKAIYLDCDILIRGSLLELYDLDCGEKLCAAVYDIDKAVRNESVQRLGLQKEYYNSGMQLIQLNRIRENMTIEQMKKSVQEYSKKLKIVYPDQDLFNKIYDGKIQKVDKIYNYCATMSIYHKLLNPKERKQAVVVHFISICKPWHSDYCSFYLFEYWRYLKKYISREEQKLYWRNKRPVKKIANLISRYMMRKIRAVFMKRHKME